MAKCTATYGLTGTDFQSQGMEYGVPVMLIFTTRALELTDANVVLYAKLMEQVRLQKAFPIKITSLVKNHEESGKVTFASRQREKTISQKRRYTATVSSNFCTAKELLKFDGFKGGVFILSSEKKIWGYHPTTNKNKGIPIDFCEVVGVDTPESDGSDVSMSTIMFDIADVNYMTTDGFIDTIDRNALDIDGLTPVTVVKTALATNTTTHLFVDVYSDCNEGCELPTEALAITDFSIAIGAAITNGTLVSIAAVAGSPGSYDITGTGFLAGQILYVDPALSVRDDAPVKSVTGYTVAIP